MINHTFKKATALLLAISMVAGMFSFNAFAATKDDTYIFEYTAWHQRSPHRFKETTADGLTYMPATYQIEGVAGSAAEGKTFVNYCCDLATSAVCGYLYKRVSIDEVTGNYYTKAEAERIRAIVAKGYHYAMTSADIAVLGKRATDAGYTVTNLTRGEALAATQHAVWVYGNSGGVTGATEVEKQYTQTMKPSTSNVASPIDYTYEPHSDLQNKLIFTYPSGTKKYGNHSSTTETNIENLKQYLLATATDKDVDVASLKGELVFSDKYFVKTYEADAVMSKGKYIVTLEFELENEISNLDQLTLDAKQGSTTIYNGSISPTSVGTLTYNAPTQEEPPVILPPDETEPPTETPPTEPTTPPGEPTTPHEENPTEPPEHSGAATTDTPIDAGAADDREHLPQTGMDWMTPLILAVLALGCFALSVIVRKKKKNS